MRRTGPLLQRAGLRLMRTAGLSLWKASERVGLDLVGATEGPPIALDPARNAIFEDFIADARRADGLVDVAGCPYPTHELLTYLAHVRGFLLHGSNHRELEVLEPRPARDGATELHAVVASDDALWPLFYAVVSRERIGMVFTACMHLGRAPTPRRFYAFAIEGDPKTDDSWTSGAMYALPRKGFRREWGNEWVSDTPVRPILRIPVPPDDFPLRPVVVGIESAAEFRRVFGHLRAAKRRR